MKKLTLSIFTLLICSSMVFAQSQASSPMVNKQPMQKNLPSKFQPRIMETIMWKIWG